MTLREAGDLSSIGDSGELVVDPMLETSQEVFLGGAGEGFVAGGWYFLVGNLVFGKLYETRAKDAWWTDWVDVSLGEQNGEIRWEIWELVVHFGCGISEIPSPTEGDSAVVESVGIFSASFGVVSAVFASDSRADGDPGKKVREGGE